jgi:phosphoribosylformylglycinamidine (FGAM) synthase-like enzyme
VLLALLEMSFGRRGECRLGIRCEQPERTAAMLFAEATGYVCAVAPENLQAFADLCRQHDVECSRIGTVLPQPLLQLQVQGEELEVELETLGRPWSRGLQDVLLEEAAR